MKNWKLVSGILSIILAAVVLLQGCAISCLSAIADYENVSGVIGVIVSIMMLVGGIESILSRDDLTTGSGTTLIIIFGIAALLGYSFTADYLDLFIWSSWCIVCAIIAIIDICIKNRETTKSKALNNQDEFLMKIADDSMSPLIKRDSIVLVKKQEIVESGKVAVVLVSKQNEAIVRKVLYGENWIKLQPINSKYPTSEFQNEGIHEVKIIGLVKEIK